MCVCVTAASIPSLVGTALPSSSNFFINYIITQGIAMIPFRIMFPHIGVLVGLFRVLRICGECLAQHEFWMLVSTLRITIM